MRVLLDTCAFLWLTSADNKALSTRAIEVY